MNLICAHMHGINVWQFMAFITFYSEFMWWLCMKDPQVSLFDDFTWNHYIQLKEEAHHVYSDSGEDWEHFTKTLKDLKN